MSRWVDWHIRLQKLNQQAVLEAQSMMEELTKETIISSGKVIIIFLTEPTIFFILLVFKVVYEKYYHFIIRSLNKNSAAIIS